MQFTKAFSALLVLLPLLVVASPVNTQSGVRVGNNGDPNAPGASSGKGQGGNNNKGGAAASSVAVSTAAASVAASASAASVPPAVSSAAATAASAAPPAASSAAASSGDAQSSLTLDPAVIATGFENDGQDVPAAGQVASLTSSNNFINFCLTVPNLNITNGQQIAQGSCNPAPMGIIAATTNMPSAKFQFPTNGAVIPSNQTFTISMAISNLDTGFFVNADENYFAAPQQIGASGNVQGHSHVVVESLSSLTDTTPTDPTHFAFFKGLNDPAANGVLTASVANGLPAGTYRLASINTAANHQPVLVAVAQHGALDDMVYFTVSDDANSTQTAPPASSSAAAAPPAASSAAAAPPAASSAASSAAASAASSAAASAAAPPAASSAAAPPAASSAAAPPAASSAAASAAAPPAASSAPPAVSTASAASTAAPSQVSGSLSIHGPNTGSSAGNQGAFGANPNSPQGQAQKGAKANH